MDHPADNNTIRLQTQHRSIRRYTGEAIPTDLLETLIRAGQGAPTSSFIQAYSIIRVTRPELRASIAKLAGGQTWIEQSAEFLVCCADLRRIDRACQQQGLGPLEGWSEHGIAATVDTALMAQNILLAAESVGLGGVFIGGIRNDPQALADLLEIPALVVPVFGLCLGWPDESPGVKPRQPLDLMLHQDLYRDPDPARVAEYDQTMADYYASRDSNAKLSDWSSTTAKATQGKKREHMLDFLRRRGFFLR